MPDLDSHYSLWTAVSAGPGFPRLAEDIEVDVAVVGAGIVGVTAAYRLRQAGRRVALIEARRVGQQTTGGSTAKVTSQHSLIYSTLAKAFDEDLARRYGEANEWAIRGIEERARTLGIECGYQEVAAYTYTTDAAQVQQVRDEARLAARLGLPARFVEEAPLPYGVAGAVVFDGQGQFDPVAYVAGVAGAFQRDGGQVFEGERATSLEEQDGAVVLEVASGRRVRARDVVVATNLPFLNDGQYFAKAAPHAHAVLAARIAGPPLDGAFISIDQPTRSVRTHQRDGETWLVLTGESFRPGEADAEAKCDDLEAFARERFEVTSVDYRWWNEDYYSIDHLPYVGRLTERHEHTYVATGFGGWGIANGDVAAHILAEAILGRESEWAAIFDSTRESPESDTSTMSKLGQLVKENLPAAKHLAERILPGDADDPSTLANGEGRILEIDGEKVAVARDRTGALRGVSSACTHMGCELGWNGLALSWDCACHGSSFDLDGAVLRGPAVSPLERRPVPDGRDG